jgi:hypothetical protein
VAPARSDACVGPSIGLDRATLAPGENVTITLTLRNCGATPLRVETSGPCHLGREVSVITDDPTGRYLLDADQTAGLLLGSVYHCPAVTIPPGPPRLTLEPGATTTDAISWNGSVMRETQTWRDDTPNVGTYADATYERLAPGIHQLSWTFGDQTAHAQLVLSGPARNATHLLLVREWDWRNGTATGASAPLGCAAAFVAGELRVPDGHLDDYALLRVFANGTATYEPWGPMGGALASPFDRALTLLYAIPDGRGGLYVNGTALAPGEETTVRVATPEGEHALVARDEGVVPARIAPCAG